MTDEKPRDESYDDIDPQTGALTPTAKAKRIAMGADALGRFIRNGEPILPDMAGLARYYEEHGGRP